MICLKGGFIHSRHNEVRDLTLECAAECFSDVEKEPLLLPLQGESLRLKTATTDPNARLDGRIRGFWCRGQSAFFDNRIFYPDADSYRNKPLLDVYRHHEQEKMRLYNERMVEVEHGSLTPLVMSSTGGLAPLPLLSTNVWPTTLQRSVDSRMHRSRGGLPLAFLSV